MSVVPANYEHIPDLVSLHMECLPNTLNVRLGKEHLTRLYRQMTKLDWGMVTVALIDGNVVIGGATATTLADAEFWEMICTTKPIDLLRIAWRILKHPSWWRDLVHANHLKGAVLTSLVVAPAYRRRGIGKNLVLAVDDFFRSRGITEYKIETQFDNIVAWAFYVNVGCQVEHIDNYGNVTFLRRLI